MVAELVWPKLFGGVVYPYGAAAETYGHFEEGLGHAGRAGFGNLLGGGGTSAFKGSGWGIGLGGLRGSGRSREF